MAKTKPSRKRASRGSGRSLGNVDANLKRPSKSYQKDEFVKIPDGESAVVRLIDLGDDFKDGYVHSVPMVGRKGKAYTRDVMCLDQDDDGTPCPGCADDLERRFKFWTRVIMRDAEKENASGKVIGYEDRIMILSSGKRLAKALNKANKSHDLSEHDIEIEREGESFETEYDVTVLDPDDPSEYSKADRKLIANTKVSLDRYTTVPDFDDFYGKEESDDDDVGARSKRRGSGFGSRKKSRPVEVEDDEDADDDDEDDDDPILETKIIRSLNRKSKSKSSGKRRRK